jgi:DNA-binding LacI/PurR family transcriptional regulator
LGYHLEEFWLREPGMSRQRIESILAARNIRGLILSPQPRYKTRVQLEWSRFAAVTFGFTLAWPQLHIVTAHCFQAMQEAITQVRSLGYRRLGLAVTSVTDQRVNRSWSGAFLGLQQHWPAQSRIPIHIPPAITHSGFMKWVKTYKPDVVISQELGLLDVLEENGFKVPQDIGFATQTITSYTHTRAISGIDENPMEAGTAAVNMVVAMINRGEYGISPINHHVLIRGTWKEGDTLVRQNGSRSELEVAESKPEDELGT